MTTATATATAAQLRDQAAEHDRKAEESFQRCDTDGALSQWADSRMAGLYRLQADIEENGGRALFVALFDLDGNLVPAKWIETRYGMAWALLDEDNPRGRFKGFFRPSEARDGHRARATDARRGYYVGYVMAPAKAELRGGNVCTVTACAVRTDGGFSRDVEIVDDGQHNVYSDTLGRWYWVTNEIYGTGE